jgi:hypothetical protein
MNNLHEPDQRKCKEPDEYFTVDFVKKIGRICFNTAIGKGQYIQEEVTSKRAKKNLYFSHCRFKFDVNTRESKQMQVSDFVKEIPKSFMIDWPHSKKPLQKAGKYEYQRLRNRRKALAS